MATPLIIPVTDSLRGGAVVTTAVLSVGGPLVLNEDTYDDSFRSATLAGTWTPAGGRVLPSEIGLLTFGDGTTTTVTHGTAFEHFDAALTVVPLAPGAAPPTEVVLGELRFAVGGDVARVFVHAATGIGGHFARGEATVSGRIRPGGRVVAVPGASRVLRIVRGGTKVFGFVDDELVLDVTFPTGTGTLSLRTTGSGVCRWSDFTMRGHVMIDEQLLEAKVDTFPERIVGEVPAAEAARVGARDVQIFGLFGLETAVGGFTYTVPDPALTVVAESGRVLLIADDPQLRDGSD